MSAHCLPRERGGAALKVLILVVVLGVAYAGVYAYGWMRLAGAESTYSRRLTEARSPPGAGQMIDAAYVRDRLIAIARQEGLEVAPDDVQVVIEPLDDQNTEKLASFERAALGIAGKLPNHDLGALFLGMRVAVRSKWGPVKREGVLERNTWVHKAIVK
jgi:hypothetical protein